MAIFVRIPCRALIAVAVAAGAAVPAVVWPERGRVSIVCEIIKNPSNEQVNSNNCNNNNSQICESSLTDLAHCRTTAWHAHYAAAAAAAAARQVCACILIVAIKIPMHC